MSVPLPDPGLMNDGCFGNALREKENGFVRGWERDVQHYTEWRTFKGISAIHSVEWGCGIPDKNVVKEKRSSPKKHLNIQRALKRADVFTSTFMQVITG